MRSPRMNPLLMLAAVPLMAAAPATVAKMKWERRVLIVAAPSAQDPSFIAQQRIVAEWRDRAAARDLSIVTIIGGAVRGSADTAPTLRQRYHLPAGAFTAILIGKDGGEKLRSPKPFPSAVLEDTIDAMPMRKAGQR